MKKSKGKSKLTKDEEIAGLKVLVERQARLISYLSHELVDTKKAYFNICVTMDMDEASNKLNKTSE